MQCLFLSKRENLACVYFGGEALYMHTDKGVAKVLLLQELQCLNQSNRYSISSFFKVFCSQLDFLQTAYLPG